MKLHTISPHESKGCARMVLESKGHWAFIIENGFPTLADCNPPMVLKLQALTPYKSKVCPIDFGSKCQGHRA